MTRHTKNSSGKYVINKREYDQLNGSRAQVWHRTAYKTNGGLRKENLFKNKHGNIVSLRKYKLGKTKGLKRLRNAGYFTKKGHFGAIRKDGTAVRKRTRKNKSKKNKSKKNKK